VVELFFQFLGIERGDLSVRVGGSGFRRHVVDSRSWLRCGLHYRRSGDASSASAAGDVGQAG
jgi:hypothetical protein